MSMTLNAVSRIVAGRIDRRFLMHAFALVPGTTVYMAVLRYGQVLTQVIEISLQELEMCDSRKAVTSLVAGKLEKANAALVKEVEKYLSSPGIETEVEDDAVLRDAGQGRVQGGEEVGREDVQQETAEQGEGGSPDAGDLREREEVRLGPVNLRSDPSYLKE